MLVTEKLYRAKRYTHSEVILRTTYWLFYFIPVFCKHKVIQHNL